jgi:hypothetical protein
VRLEGLGQLKNPMTSLGIEPSTFRLLAQCLNQLRYQTIKEKKFQDVGIKQEYYYRLNTYIHIHMQVYMSGILSPVLKAVKRRSR